MDCRCPPQLHNTISVPPEVLQSLWRLGELRRPRPLCDTPIVRRAPSVVRLRGGDARANGIRLDVAQLSEPLLIRPHATVVPAAALPEAAGTWRWCRWQRLDEPPLQTCEPCIGMLSTWCPQQVNVVPHDDPGMHLSRGVRRQMLQACDEVVLADIASEEWLAPLARKRRRSGCPFLIHAGRLTRCRPRLDFPAFVCRRKVAVERSTTTSCFGVICPSLRTTLGARQSPPKGRLRNGLLGESACRRGGGRDLDDPCRPLPAKAHVQRSAVCVGFAAGRLTGTQGTLRLVSSTPL